MMRWRTDVQSSNPVDEGKDDARSCELQWKFDEKHLKCLLRAFGIQWNDIVIWIIVEKDKYIYRVDFE